MEEDNKIDPIKAYDEKVLYLFWLSLYLKEQNLENDFEEWCIEKKLEFKLFD